MVEIATPSATRQLRRGSCTIATEELEIAAVGYIWVGIGVLGIIDAFLHSSSDWDYADRNRPFWVIFMFFFGPIFVLPYLLLVRPRFPSREAREDVDQFLKR